MLFRSERLGCILAGGDDYELLFTTPADRRAEVWAIGERLGLPLTRIGRIEAEPGLRLWQGGLDDGADGASRVAVPNRWTSFDHFKG